MCAGRRPAHSTALRARLRRNPCARDVPLTPLRCVRRSEGTNARDAIPAYSAALRARLRRNQCAGRPAYSAALRARLRRNPCAGRPAYSAALRAPLRRNQCAGRPAYSAALRARLRRNQCAGRHSRLLRCAACAAPKEPMRAGRPAYSAALRARLRRNPCARDVPLTPLRCVRGPQSPIRAAHGASHAHPSRARSESSSAVSGDGAPCPLTPLRCVRGSEGTHARGTSRLLRFAACAAPTEGAEPVHRVFGGAAADDVAGLFAAHEQSLVLGFSLRG